MLDYGRKLSPCLPGTWWDSSCAVLLVVVSGKDCNSSFCLPTGHSEGQNVQRAETTPKFKQTRKMIHTYFLSIRTWFNFLVNLIKVHIFLVLGTHFGRFSIFDVDFMHASRSQMFFVDTPMTTSKFQPALSHHKSSVTRESMLSLSSSNKTAFKRANEEGSSKIGNLVDSNAIFVTLVKDLGPDQSDIHKYLTCIWLHLNYVLQILPFPKENVGTSHAFRPSKWILFMDENRPKTPTPF